MLTKYSHTFLHLCQHVTDSINTLILCHTHCEQLAARLGSIQRNPDVMDLKAVERILRSVALVVSQSKISPKGTFLA
jgi:hypothetical protein